ncbi:hypothetical protein ES707_19249 [subsurface metagenome]
MHLLEVLPELALYLSGRRHGDEGLRALRKTWKRAGSVEHQHTVSMETEVVTPIAKDLSQERQRFFI